VSVCLSAAACHTIARTGGPRCNLGNGRGSSLVVRYLADLQSVQGLRCYGNTTRTPNVSEYMLVLSLCLVKVLRPTRQGAYQGGIKRFLPHKLPKLDLTMDADLRC